MAHANVTYKTGFLDLPRELRDGIYTNIISNIMSSESPEIRDFDVQSPDFLNVCAAHPTIAREIRERDQATRKCITFHLEARSAPWIPPATAYKRLEQIRIEFKTYKVDRDSKGNADRCPRKISEVAKHVAEIVKWINTYSFLPSSSSGSDSPLRHLWVEFEDRDDGNLSFYDEFWDPHCMWHSERARRLAYMDNDLSWSPVIVERLLEPLRKVQPGVFQEARIWEINDVMSDKQSQDCGFFDEVHDNLWASDYFYGLQTWICGHQREGEKEKMEWVEHLEKYW